MRPRCRGRPGGACNARAGNTERGLAGSATSGARRVLRATPLTGEFGYPNFIRMQRAPVLTKTLLAVIVLAAQLCPCPSMAAAPTEDPSGGHAHHMTAASTGMAQPSMEDCHGAESRDDCGMTETSDSGARPDKQERSGDLYKAVGDAPAVVLDIGLRFTVATHPPRSPKNLRNTTPVTFSDRMLN